MHVVHSVLCILGLCLVVSVCVLCDVLMFGLCHIVCAAAAGVDRCPPWSTLTSAPRLFQKRRRIDRSMIGEPTNFVHLGHVGANDMQQQGSRYLNQLQSQMCSKGQYQNNGQPQVRVSS